MPALPARRSPSIRVLLLACALFGVSALVLLVPSVRVRPGTVIPPWWVISILVAAAEIWTFRLSSRRESRYISASELPLVLGLFALSPLSLLFARLLGSGVVFVFHRRSTMLKSLFNLGLVGANTAVATLVFHLVGGGAPVTEPRAWAAAVVAASCAGALDGLILAVVFSWYDGSLSWPHLIRHTAMAILLPAAVSVFGLLAAVTLTLGQQAVIPLLLATVGLVIVYRSYSVLAARHLDMERLYDLSKELHEADTVDEMARPALIRAVAMSNARYGELVILTESGELTRWSLDCDGPVAVTRLDGVWSTSLEAAPAVAVTESLWLRPTEEGGWAEVTGSERLPERGASDLARLGAYLEERGFREALAFPIFLSKDSRGALLISERSGESRGYRPDHRRTFETVARHATVALRHAQAMQRLTYEARHDQLTGLPNRATFLTEANHALQRLGQGERLAVGVMDLDGFKTLNDSLGHHAGDAVIAEVGRRLMALGDDRIFVARLGGDEFALLIRAHYGEDDMIAIGRRLLGCLKEEVLVEGDRVHLAGSLGLAQAPRDGVTPDALMRSADFAMYFAKNGSGGLALFGRDVTHPASDLVALAADLRLGLSRDELQIAVQPLIDLRTRRMHSVEVLARWRHPMLGHMEPEVFVAAAEKGGLTGEFTRAVLDRALHACRTWMDAGLEMRVAVNLSARAIDDDDLPERLEQLLGEHGVPGRLLAIELTEGGLLDNPARVLPILSKLRALGIRLAIDDFGTGYSSMTYVSELAPDQMKIDKSFIQRLPLQGRDAAIVRSIIDLGKNLGVEVVAEGVSDPMTAHMVDKLGCRLAQGFLFAEPMPWEQLPGWLVRFRETSEPVPDVTGDGREDPPEDGGQERLRLVR
jgi:diguanylate cyclase (GGDEF)-like protein